MKNVLYKYNEKTLKSDPVSWYEINKPMLFVLFCTCVQTMLFIIYYNYTEIVKSDMVLMEQEIEFLKNENSDLKEIVSIINENEGFSESNLYSMLQGMNIKFIDIVMAQAELESGRFKSDLFKETGNLFGMKAARVRPYTHFGEVRGHADYKGNWRLSVIDYALWQARELKDVKSEQGFYFKLNKIYAEDPEYIIKLKSLVNKKRNS